MSVIFSVMRRACLEIFNDDDGDDGDDDDGDVFVCIIRLSWVTVAILTRMRQ